MTKAQIKQIQTNNKAKELVKVKFQKTEFKKTRHTNILVPLNEVIYSSNDRQIIINSIKSIGLKVVKKNHTYTVYAFGSNFNKTAKVNYITIKQIEAVINNREEKYINTADSNNLMSIRLYKQFRLKVLGYLESKEE